MLDNATSVTYKGGSYVILSEAADRVGVHPQTLLRWIRSGKRANGGPIKAIQDPMSRQYYVSEHSVECLTNPDARFLEVEEQAS